MSGQDWTQVVGAVGLFTLVTVVISVTIVQLATTARAKAKLAREAEYRKLAETVAETQLIITRQLTELGVRAEQSHQQLSAIERILTQVE
jgi:hypothetical protein